MKQAKEVIPLELVSQRVRASVKNAQRKKPTVLDLSNDYGAFKVIDQETNIGLKTPS